MTIENARRLARVHLDRNHRKVSQVPRFLDQAVAGGPPSESAFPVLSVDVTLKVWSN